MRERFELKSSYIFAAMRQSPLTVGDGDRKRIIILARQAWERRQASLYLSGSLSERDTVADARIIAIAKAAPRGRQTSYAPIFEPALMMSSTLSLTSRKNASTAGSEASDHCPYICAALPGVTGRPCSIRARTALFAIAVAAILNMLRSASLSAFSVSMNVIPWLKKRFCRESRKGRKP